jgi:hypothetical protein
MHGQEGTNRFQLYGGVCVQLSHFAGVCEDMTLNEGCQVC